MGLALHVLNDRARIVLIAATVAKEHVDERGHIADGDESIVVHIGIKTIEHIQIIAEQRINNRGHVTDAHGAVAVGVTCHHRIFGFLIHLNIDDIGRVLHAIDGVVELDTNAPVEERNKAVGFLRPSALEGGITDVESSSTVGSK